MYYFSIGFNPRKPTDSIDFAAKDFFNGCPAEFLRSDVIDLAKQQNIIACATLQLVKLCNQTNWQGVL